MHLLLYVKEMISRKIFSDLSCSDEKHKKGSLAFLRGLKSQGQCSLSKLKGGLVLKISSPVAQA